MFFAAAIQFHPQLGKLEENLVRLEEAIRQAAASGAKFIVTPELAVSGYMYDTRECIFPSADTIPGKVTDRFHALCLHLNIYLVLGMPEYEEETGLLYNSAALIGPEGLIGKYRKTHLWEAEAHWATPGNLGFPVFQTELGSIAINICMDAVYMESSRIPALHGADILAFPTNSSAQTISMLQGWATLNGMYIVSANRADEERGFQMAGASAIWSPYGEKLVEAKTSLDGGEEEIIYGVIDPKLFDNPNRARLLKRRPELYRDVMLHIGPWNYRKTEAPQTVHVHSFTGPDSIEAGSLEKYFSYWKEKVSAVKQGSKTDGFPSLMVMPALSATGSIDELTYEEAVYLSQMFAVEWLPKYQQLAKDQETNLILSAPECGDGQVFLAAWVIGQNGDVLQVHRSTHLREEDSGWAQGEELKVVFIKGIGRVGVLFEEEAFFPEVPSSYGIQRVDIIALLAEETSDDEYSPLLDDRFHGNGENRSTLKAVWENLAMHVQAYVAFSGWKHAENISRTAIYSVDPYYEKEASILADEEGAAASMITTLRSDAWYNQQHWIVSRRVEHYYPIVAKTNALVSIMSPLEEDNMMA